MTLWRKMGEWRFYYTWAAIICKRAWLWVRIVGRINQADYRTGPKLAWEICCIVWNGSDHISSTSIYATSAKNGIVGQPIRRTPGRSA